MSDDETTIRDDDNRIVFSSPEIYSPLFTNGTADFRAVAKSPVYKRLRQLVEERLAAASPAAK
ncbi:MAG TPA: hypothetical protein VFX51_10260 [Solirubrobacteraceae bacterium]|nr:hypothetical protein [Solirubrobacteraceae bacterium]